MKTSDLFNYQKEAMRLLNNSYEKDKLVHAYLLDGDKGSGTVDAAIYMAKKLICKSEEKPCNTCNDCKRVYSLEDYVYCPYCGNKLDYHIDDL